MIQTMMNKDKIERHIRENDGICIECGAIKHGGVEPDAVNYVCEECGENKVVGFEAAVLYEWVVPTDSKTPTLDTYKEEK
jgi:Zn finger protein HypA/HybF involved in hydrogenase expression